MSQPRRPAGSPGAGRFAPSAHTEADTDLEQPKRNPLTLPPLTRQDLSGLTQRSADADPVELADEIREQLRRAMATGRFADWHAAWESITADGWFRYRPSRCPTCRGRGWDGRTGGACRSCAGTRRATESISVRALRR